jgi:hypothetical protein
VSQPAWVDLRGELPGSDNTPAGPHYATRTLEQIRFIVIHHSAVDADSSAETIAAYHTQPHGPLNEVWPGCGYAFVVRWNGTIEYATDMLRCGYQVASRNTECLGVCLPGLWEKKVPGALQLAGASDLVEWLRNLLPWAAVVGHRDVALPGWETECPGSTWPAWRATLL